MEKELNVVFLGPVSFPLGSAMSKRWRYLVDYMNSHNIQSHVLVCHHKISNTIENPIDGQYGLADFHDLRHYFAQKKIPRFYDEGKKYLREWFIKERKNILIFTNDLDLFLLPFFLYAKKLGYKILFDQVETSLLLAGKMRLRRRINLFLSKYISDYAYKQSDCLVISSGLWKQNHDKYPQMKLCLLPNSTPDLQMAEKKSLHSPLRVVYSGTFAEKDGVEYLIDGAIEAHRRGCNLELIMTGKGQPWNMKVLDKVKGCSWVKYLGFVSDDVLKQTIQQADVLCMTRNNSVFANYGFPFKLSEYLATGNILLATRVGDVERYVTDKKDAFMVDPENAHQIADALCYIATNEEEVIQIARRGHETMMEKFSIECVGKIFENFLSSL